MSGVLFELKLKQPETEIVESTLQTDVPEKRASGESREGEVAAVDETHSADREVELSSGPHHQDSGEAKIRESTAGVSRKPSSDGKACGCSSKHLCGLTAWNT